MEAGGRWPPGADGALAAMAELPKPPATTNKMLSQRVKVIVGEPCFKKRSNLAYTFRPAMSRSRITFVRFGS